MDISSVSKCFSVSLLQTAVKSYIKPISYLIGALALGIIFRAAYQQVKSKLSKKSNLFSKLSTHKPLSPIERQADKVNAMTSEQKEQETDNSSGRAIGPKSPFRGSGVISRFVGNDETSSAASTVSNRSSKSPLDSSWTNPSRTLLGPNLKTSTIPDQRQIAALLPNRSQEIITSLKEQGRNQAEIVDAKDNVGGDQNNQQMNLNYNIIYRLYRISKGCASLPFWFNVIL